MAVKILLSVFHSKHLIHLNRQRQACNKVLFYFAPFDPLTDYRVPLKQIKEWFPLEVVDRKREEIANLLKDLMKETNIDVESLNLPTLTFGGGDSFEEALANEEALASELAGEEEEEEDASMMEYEESVEHNTEGSSEERDESVLSGSQGDAASLNKSSSSSELNEEPLSEDRDQIFSSSFSAIGASETVGSNEAVLHYSSSDNLVPLVSYADSDDEETLVQNFPANVHSSVDNIKRINQEVINGPVKRLKTDVKTKKSIVCAHSSVSSGGLPQSRQ